MAEKRQGAIFTMMALAAMLLAVGVWQFGTLSLNSSEDHESDKDHDHKEYSVIRKNDAQVSNEVSTLLNRIASEENGRIVEVEQEIERGRQLYEIKLVGSDGRFHEIKVDAESGEVIERE